LYEHWNMQRGLRAAPEHGDIKPGAIRHVLADTFILGLDPRVGHPFRIAGTRLCAAFGRELKGMPFVALWDRQSQALVRELLGVVAQEAVGVVAGARGTNADGSELGFELIVLPLRHHGRTDARVIGALAPLEVPYWLGARELSRLSLGTIRYLRPETSSATVAALRPVPPAATLSAALARRRRFVVYEGGRR
jgi:hypothetical protein